MVFDPLAYLASTPAAQRAAADAFAATDIGKQYSRFSEGGYADSVVDPEGQYGAGYGALVRLNDEGARDSIYADYALDHYLKSGGDPFGEVFTGGDGLQRIRGYRWQSPKQSEYDQQKTAFHGSGGPFGGLMDAVNAADSKMKGQIGDMAAVFGTVVGASELLPSLTSAAGNTTAGATAGGIADTGMTGMAAGNTAAGTTAAGTTAAGTGGVSGILSGAGITNPMAQAAVKNAVTQALLTGNIDPASLALSTFMPQVTPEISAQLTAAGIPKDMHATIMRTGVNAIRTGELNLDPEALARSYAGDVAGGAVSDAAGGGDIGRFAGNVASGTVRTGDVGRAVESAATGAINRAAGTAFDKGLDYVGDAIFDKGDTAALPVDQVGAMNGGTPMTDAEWAAFEQQGGNMEDWDFAPDDYGYDYDANDGTAFMSDKALADLAAYESGGYDQLVGAIADASADGTSWTGYGESPWSIYAGDPFETTEGVNKDWSGDVLGYLPAQLQAAIEGKASWDTVGLGSGITGGKSIKDLMTKSSGGGKTSLGGGGQGGAGVTNVVNAGNKSSLLEALMAMAGKQGGSQPGEGGIGAAERARMEAQQTGRM